jgi:hypothetical protein
VMDEEAEGGARFEDARARRDRRGDDADHEWDPTGEWRDAWAPTAAS